jgi:hypothetical protein
VEGRTRTRCKVSGVCILCLALASSCKKEVEESVQSAEDNAQIENEYAQIYDVVRDYVANDYHTAKTSAYILPDGATVTFTDTTFDDGDGVDILINYGPLTHSGSAKGILCSDMRYRAGVVHAGVTGKWSVFPDTLTIAISAADNYYVGNGTKMYKVTGTQEVIRTSETNSKVNVTDATLQRDNGTAKWAATRDIRLLNDAGTGWLDDKYGVLGSAEGINANGVAYTAEIGDELIKQLSVGCMSTFTEGTQTITNTDGDSFVIDYAPDGNTDCDKLVKVTVNGNKSREITLW